MSVRRFVAALAASVVLAQPLAAQDRTTVSELEDLIPDSALDNPEDWARQGVPAEASAAEDAPPELQPSDPLAEMPLVDVPWPEELELPQVAPLEPEEGIVFAEADEQLPALPEGAEERISDELVLVFPSEASLFPEREEFLERFRQLSTVEEYDDENSVARLAAQARADEDLLQRMLRIYG
jgi:translocation and assembly module TamA